MKSENLKKIPRYRIKERLRIGVFTKGTNIQVSLKSILFTKHRQDFKVIKRRPDKIYKVSETFFGKERIERGLGHGYRILEREFEVTPLGFTAPSLPWGKVDEIDLKMKQRCCQAQRYWEVDSNEIQDIARAFDSTKDIFELSRSISEYVQTHITHREFLKERFGALRTLINKYGDCDEFTDLFVTLCRAVGLPARRITGVFVKSDLKPENHAWAEIYSPKIRDWIPIDVALKYFGFQGNQHLSRKIEETHSDRPDFSLQVKSSHSYKAEIEQEEIKIVEVQLI